MFLLLPGSEGRNHFREVSLKTIVRKIGKGNILRLHLLHLQTDIAARNIRDKNPSKEEIEKIEKGLAVLVDRTWSTS